jgi:hypothetical protein
MFCGVEVFRGMFVLGGIATAYVATSQTEAKMHPAIAHFEALFATFGLWLDLFDLLKMCANISHRIFLSY